MCNLCVLDRDCWMVQLYWPKILIFMWPTVPWNSFSGVLVSITVKTESADDRPLNIDDSFNYCEPCLKRFQEGVIAQSKSHGTKSNTHNVPPLSKITKYSPKTATSAMIRHLFDQHSISIVAASNAKRSVGGPVQATLSFASGRAGSGVVSASKIC